MSRVVTAPGRAREYETIYILKPDIDADAAEKLGSRLNDVIGREAGRLTKVETWGRRRLAYDIAKHRRGVYMYLKFLGSGRTVSEVERNLRLADGVLKYQTILLSSDVQVEGFEVADEDVKWDRLELPPLEEDREDSRERQLGLVEPERRVEQREGHAEEGEEFAEAAAAPAEEEEEAS